jgi:hypothetical protein
MTTRSWIGRLFARQPRTGREEPVRFRPRLERLETRLAPTVNVLNNFGGQSSNQPPDTDGGAGPNSYIETVNQSVAIYDKGTGNTIVSASTTTLFTNLFGGGLVNGYYLGDTSSCYDAAIGRFIVAELQTSVDSFGRPTAPSALDLCVSRSPNPRTLTVFDWRMYQFESNEGNLWSDYPGNFGYNQDAFVVTFNMIDNSGSGQPHSLVFAINQGDLKTVSPAHWNPFDLPGQAYRPVVMHDSVAGGPMWLVQTNDNSSINLFRFDNILNSAARSQFTVPVNPFGQVNNPLNPDGTPITTHPIDRWILNAAESNNRIVACQDVGVGTNEDDSAWYEFNVSDINKPTVVDQGNVGFGPDTYTVYPGIDINSAGDIGMSVIRSGKDSPTDYMSVWVAGRTAADVPGQMYTWLARAGDSNNRDTKEGDLSGINLDPNDGTFWTANEFTSNNSGATQITHFSIDDAVQAYIDNNRVLQVVGSNANDKIALQYSTSNSSRTEVMNNGNVVGDFANDSFSKINVVAGPGNDTLSFADNSNSYHSTTLNTGTGNDTVNVYTTSGPLNVSNPGGQATVYVYAQGITDAMNVTGAGATSLTVDDSNDPTGRTATLSDGSITGLVPATISWTLTNRASSVTVLGGSGGNTFNVLNTSNFLPPTTLNTGTGNDTVNVEGTTGELDVVNPGGQDAVYVGSKGSALGGNVQGINGAVVVTGAGATVLTVDDSGDTIGRTATLSEVLDGWITGLAPAPIICAPTSSATGGVTGLSVYGGSGGNTFRVYRTSNFYRSTDLHTGTGNDAVSVYATVGALNIDNPGGQDSVTLASRVGNPLSPYNNLLSGITGPVNVSGAGATSLTLNDSGDTTGRTATLSDGAITGLSPATISWTPTSGASGGVTSLTVKGGSGGNTFTVTNTSNFLHHTMLNTGTGNDIVNVEGTTGALRVFNPGGQDRVYVGSNGSALGGNVQGIVGGVNVSGAGGTSLIVDDRGYTTARRATLSDGAITGLAPATISWTPSSTNSGGVYGLIIAGGSGGNTFTVTNTSNFWHGTLLSTGAGNDTVNVKATTGALAVYNPGGQDSVSIATAFANFHGPVQTINGPVTVYGPGATSLTVDDSVDTIGRAATLSDVAIGGGRVGTITGLGPATISWIPTSSASGGVTDLTVKGGSGGNTFNVTNTSTFLTSTTLNTGTGGDTVNVSGTTGALNVVNPAGQDSVFVGGNGSALGGGNVQGITGAVSVSGAGATDLVVDDGGDTTGRTATLSDGAITGLAPAAISWTPTVLLSGGVTRLRVFGGSGGNTFTVTSTSTFATGATYLFTAGNDVVNVKGTTGGLSVVSRGGLNRVYVGSTGSALGGNVQGINGAVIASGPGAIVLTVDDSGDATGRTPTLSDGTLTGLAPATISWTPTSTASGGVVTLSVYGGSGGNTFTVTNTSKLYASTALITGTGNDVVNVQGTTGALYVVNPGGQDSVYVDSNGSAPGGNVQGIKGNVFVYGAGATSLLVDDRGDTTPCNATLSDVAFAGGRSGTITGLAPADISWIPTGSATGGVTDLTVFGGSGGNTFTVTNTSAFYGSTTLRTGSGNDTVNVEGTTGALRVFNPGGQDSVYVGSNGSAPGGNVQGINGAVIVSSFGGGPTSLVVDDSGDTQPQSATLSNGALTGLAPATISYGSGVTALTVNGSQGASTYTVPSTRPGTATTVNAGAANDVFHVGDTTHALSGLQGALTLNGGPGTNTVTFTDTAQSGKESYSLSTTALTGGGMAGVSFTGLQGLTFSAGTGAVSLAVTAVSASLPVTYTGGGGSDTLQGPDSANTWQITAANAGTLDQAVSFSAVQNLTGGAVSDTFKFQTGGSLAGRLNGGAGTNTLDYSGYVGNITVDLPLGLATAVTGGISNVQNVTGSRGDDLIVGDANPNVLVGGTGRNIIIGGGGGDTIRGGGGDNILIAGTTAYDTDPALAGLNAIFTEWASSHDLATRRQNIQVGGGLNGTYYLNVATSTPATVFRAAVADKLYDGGGLSWFFVSSTNEINDGNGPSNPNDVVTTLP